MANTMNAVTRIRTNPTPIKHPVELPAVRPASNIPSPLAGIPVGYGPGGPLPPPTAWTQYGTYLQWNGGVVVGNPTGGSLGPGSINATAYFVNGASFDLGNYLPLTGGIITGPVVFQGTVDGLSLDMGTF
jgi:hypothetical protein